MNLINIHSVLTKIVNISKHEGRQAEKREITWV
jgi:hypothetical protein